MRKWIIGLSTLALVGCSSQSVATPEPTATAEITAEPIAEVISVNFETIEAASLSYANELIENGQIATYANTVIQSVETLGSVTEVYPVLDADRIGAYVDFSDGTRWCIRYDDQLQIIDDAVSTIPGRVELEVGVGYRETIVKIGKEPQLTAILTTPTTGVAPVTILLGETDHDLFDASGDDPTFRKELAHLLAQNGVATLRYDMRLGMDEHLYLDGDIETIDRTYGWDFASAVHILEDLDVDHTDYSVLAVGANTQWAAGLTSLHYEVRGGLILIDMPEKTGVEYIVEPYALSDDEVLSLKSYLSEADSAEMLYDMPVSELQKWASISIINGIATTSAPILLIAGETDVDEDAWDYWTTTYRNRRRLSTHLFEDLDHHFRDDEGVMDEDAVQALAEWIKTGVFKG